MNYSTLRTLAIALLGVVIAATSASAETLLMPKRDALRNNALVIWGVTTLPNGAGTTFTINFGDGSPNAAGPVNDRSYINTSHVFATAGTFTVTLEVKNGATTETATVDVRVVDPAAIGGPGSTTGNVGPGSHDVYRDVRINMAIQDGLRYLWTSQNSRTTNFPSGSMVSWPGGFPQQWTAFAVTAFENHGYRLANDGSAPTGIYEKYIVQKGLNYLVSQLAATNISSQTTASAAGQPTPRNPCVGIGIEASPCQGLIDNSNSPGYTIGIAMMPFAASSALSRANGAFGPAIAQNKTYREILQRLANTLTHGQIDVSGAPRGGWGYAMNTTVLDGSVMGWAILGLLDAQAATIVVPDWVKTELVFALTGAWNNNGSFDYNADGNANSLLYSGMEKAGIGLQGMFMIGEIGGGRVTATRGYISDRWNSAGRVGSDTAYWNCGGNNNKSCAYSMFNNFKGLKLQGIATLPGVGRAAGPGGIPLNDWHADYEDWFVNNQQAANTAGGGYWNMTFSNFANDTTPNVALAELILSNVALVLPDGDKFASVGLSPATATAVEGNQHTLTAKAESTEGSPVAGATVNFQIISGPNAGLTGVGVTNAAGQATFTYTDAGPIPSFGTDRIRANIGTLQSNISEMIWTPFNRPPVANPNSYSVNEDGTLNGNVVTDAPADTDPDNDVLHASLESPVSHGLLNLSSSGAFDYKPITNYCGADSFTYSVNDGMYDSDVVTVSITVVCVNDSPAADDAVASTDEDTAVGGNLTSTDVDGGAPSYTLDGAATSGAAIVNPDGSFTYTPNANFCGSDSFTFNVSDGAASDSGVVSVTVNCVNDAPVANDGVTSTNEDTAANGQLTSTDVDGGAPSYSLDAAATSGTAVVNGDGGFTYTPNADFCGSDSFTYTVSDGTASDGGVVNITVNCVNDAPVADDATAATDEDHAVNGQLTSTDLDGGAPSYSLDAAATSGTAVVNGDGSFTYTPNANFCGSDSFTFKVNDGSASDGGAVSVTVNCVNDTPNAVDDSNSTTEDTPVSGSVAGNDGDVEHDTLTYALGAGPSNGTAVVNGAGAYTYTPAANFCGTDSFTYTAGDGASSDTATVTIGVTCVNDTPNTGNDSSATAEDTPVSGSVAGNDSDVEHETLTYALGTGAANGVAVVNPDGSYSYTPASNFCGTDSFTYTASDASSSGTATVTIAVTCVNDTPNAVDDSNSTTEDTPVSGSVAGNDSDVEHDTLTYTVGTGPSHGTAAVNGAGAYTYTPAADFCGTDSFTYKASDASSSDTGTVTITVTCVNDAPVANDSSASTPEDTPKVGALTSSDVDGGTPTYAVSTTPSHGTVVINATGTYTYTPAANYNGPDSFTFTVSDGRGGSDTGQVNITVAAVNDAPFCGAAAPTVGLLWPPNHQLVNINVLGVTDPVENSAVTIKITSIWQDEPTNTQGDGNTPIDGYGVGTSTAQVRAERSGSPKVPGDGRMYHINFTGTDAGGATCTGEVKVGVPHDQGNGNSVTDGGPLYKSTGA